MERCNPFPALPPAILLFLYRSLPFYTPAKFSTTGRTDRFLSRLFTCIEHT